MDKVLFLVCLTVLGFFIACSGYENYQKNYVKYRIAKEVKNSLTECRDGVIEVEIDGAEKNVAFVQCFLDEEAVVQSFAYGVPFFFYKIKFDEDYKITSKAALNRPVLSDSSFNLLKELAAIVLNPEGKNVVYAVVGADCGISMEFLEKNWEMLTEEGYRVNLVVAGFSEKAKRQSGVVFCNKNKIKTLRDLVNFLFKDLESCEEGKKYAERVWKFRDEVLTKKNVFVEVLGFPVIVFKDGTYWVGALMPHDLRFLLETVEKS